MGDTQKTDIHDNSVGSGDGTVVDHGGESAVNAIGGAQVTGGGTLTYNSLDAGTVKNALDSNAALVAQVLKATADFQDKSTASLSSTVAANNALSTGTLTTLRDALSSTLQAPQIAGDAANSGAGFTTWVKENPALAAAIALGVLLILRSKS